MKKNKKKNSELCFAKLSLSNKFSFYKEDGIYNTSDLYEFYISKVKTLGKKFDERNGNSYFRKQIDKHLNN